MTRVPYSQEFHLSPPGGGGDAAAPGSLMEKAGSVLRDIKRGEDSKLNAVFGQFLKPGKPDQLVKEAGRIAGKTKQLIVFGTGGSSLGAQTLLSLAPAGGAVKITFIDNLAPEITEATLKTMDPAATHFLVISKSGYTMEVIAQGLIALENMSRILGEGALKQHFTFITQPSDNPLRSIAKEWSIPVLDHDPDLTGRFSVFSSVGLLPALVGGVDTRQTLAGAKAVLDQALEGAALDSIPAVKGALFSASAERYGNCFIHVMMPYVNRLQMLTKWFVQLWAESLGKKGRGTTPVAALGPLDQHSQLQMFLDGRQDKFFSFIKLRQSDGPSRIDGFTRVDGRLEFLHGKSLEDVVTAAYLGTVRSIRKAGRSCRTFHLETLDQYTLGGLLMHFMLETIMVAEMLEVPPFKQERVEDGKNHARDYLKNQASSLF